MKPNWNKFLSLTVLLVVGLLLFGSHPVHSQVSTSQGRVGVSAIAPPIVAQNYLLVEEPNPNYPAALAELQNALTFQGEPLNPRAVAALLPWLSDSLPGAIAVDIEGTTADTNQFNAQVFQDDEGRVTAEWTTSEERRFVVYRPVGQLDNGIHALRTWVNAGGSGVFPFLMLVEFDLDTEIKGGTQRQRLVMKRRGEFILGNGYDGDITVSGNTITFTPAPSGAPSMTVTVD